MIEQAGEPVTSSRDVEKSVSSPTASGKSAVNIEIPKAKAAPQKKNVRPKSTAIADISKNVETGSDSNLSEVKEPEGNPVAGGHSVTENHPFTKEDLCDAWKRYLKTLEKNNASLHSILQNHPPELLENDTIGISVLYTQKNELESGKTQLINYLRKEIKNNNISLSIKIQKQEEVSKKVFTAADKFKMMAEKNPALREMKKKLGLDLD